MLEHSDLDILDGLTAVDRDMTGCVKACGSSVSSVHARQEMAQRLSFDWSTSVTVGRAVADWLAARKGTYLGVMEVDEAAEQAAKEQTNDLPTRTLEIMVGTRIIGMVRYASSNSRHRNTCLVSYIPATSKVCATRIAYQVHLWYHIYIYEYIYYIQ